MSELSTLLFIDGIGFDPFFRGLLSVLVAVVVLIGGTYLLVATNAGARQGLLITFASLFGWMFLMGIIWSAYGLGWVGNTPSWDLAEVNVDDADDGDDGLLFSEIEAAHGLHGKVIVVEGVDDPDEAQAQALAMTQGDDPQIDLNGWRYMTTANGLRGEAQAAADTYILEEEIFASGEYKPIQFGGFVYGGKAEPPEDANLLQAGWHKVKTSLQIKHPDKFVAIQVRAVKAEPTLPGQAPPVPDVDEEAKLVTVILKLNRGGPLPNFISGLRFVPVVFTIANAALFAACALALHNRDRREAAVLASK